MNFPPLCDEKRSCAVRFRSCWTEQKGHKESWGKHPWEGTKGAWQPREEKQLLSKQKRYQVQRLRELQQGNGKKAPGSVQEPVGAWQKWICADPPQAPRTSSLWAGEKSPTQSSDLCMAVCVPIRLFVLEDGLSLSQLLTVQLTVRFKFSVCQ